MVPTRRFTLLTAHFAAALALGEGTPTTPWLLAGPSSAISVGFTPLMPPDPGEADEAVLFAFDDHAIPYSSNLTLGLETPAKHPANPVLTIGRPGQPDEWQVRYFGSVVRHEGKFKMWYVAMDFGAFADQPNGGPLVNDGRSYWFAYAESADGVNWVKPNLGLVDFRGSKDNNLIELPPGFKGYHVIVRYEPNEPDPTRRFKMMPRLVSFGALKDRLEPALAVGGGYVPLYSADGLRWRVADEITAALKRPDAPPPSLPARIEGSGFYRWRGLYYLTGQGSRSEFPARKPYGRHVMVFSSPDLVNWSPSPALAFHREGQFNRPANWNPERPHGSNEVAYANEQTHEGISAWHRGNVLIGLTGLWHGDSDWRKTTHPLGLLISNDGVHFREPLPNFEFSTVGERGRDWDHSGLGQGDGFENVGDRTYIWYGAPTDQGAGRNSGLGFPREGGVGLLVLDRDRFGFLSLRNPDRDGILISAPIAATRPVRLSLNLEGAGPDSPVHVELLDAWNRPLAAYASSAGATVTRSGLRQPVTFASGSAVIDLPDQPFRIRATMTGPLRSSLRIYALYLAP
ncbi:MAG: hypothetical protein JNJ82_03000 [Opitutaceae bacterium]|nr:hypothetical protein [Opitutaceae bacterium]